MIFAVYETWRQHAGKISIDMKIAHFQIPSFADIQSCNFQKNNICNSCWAAAELECQGSCITTWA